MIEELESLIGDPAKGLPEDIFLFISRITPLVNVDLLIKDEQNRTMLTWRDEAYSPPGWHVPGGIIRFKETFADRIHAVAQKELGTGVTFSPAPLAFNQVIHPSRKDRGHFISLLFDCRLMGHPSAARECHGKPRSGDWAWHDRCPDSLIPVHEMYRSYMN